MEPIAIFANVFPINIKVKSYLGLSSNFLTSLFTFSCFLRLKKDVSLADRNPEIINNIIIKIIIFI